MKKFIQTSLFFAVFSLFIYIVLGNFHSIILYPVSNKRRPILKAWSKKRKTDTFESLTRCYRPLPCCKVSIQLQSPLFDSDDRLWCGARLAVLREASILISSTWSRIFVVNTVKNPLQSSCQPKTTCATAHQSKTGLNTSVAMRENLAWECEYIKKKKKVCRWHFSLTPSKYVWVDKTQSIFNKLHHARSYELKKQQVGYKIYFRGTLRIFVAF